MAKGPGAARFAALVGALTPAQRRAVAATLRALAEGDENSSIGDAAAACLESYRQSELREGAGH